MLAQMEAGTVHAEPQDEALVTYAEKLTKSEAIIDWTQPASTHSQKGKRFKCMAGGSNALSGRCIANLAG